jgi:hypothetical protein
VCWVFSTDIGSPPFRPASLRWDESFPPEYDALRVSTAHPPYGLFSYIGWLLLAANFLELREREVPRTSLPRRRVNKARSRPAEPNPSGFAGPTTTRKPWYSSWWRRLLGRYKRRGFCVGIQLRDSNPNYSRSGIGPSLLLASSRFRECLFRRRYVTWRRTLGFHSADPGHTAPQTLRSQPAARR